MTNSAARSSARIGTSGWQSAVELRQLRVFLAVAEHGNLSAAAQSLGLAQSTVSEALAALDRAIGTATIRRRRGAHATLVTAAGEALLPYARRMLQDIDAMHSAIAEVTQRAQGNVHVMANESVSTYVLAPVLATIRRRWPKVQIAVTVGTCGDIRGAIATGRCDVGLLLDEPSGRNHEDAATQTAIVLAPDVPLRIVAAPSHPLASERAFIRRDALQPFALLIADAAGDFHHLVHRYFSAEGLPGPRLDSVGSIEAVKRGVAADTTTLGLLPDYAVAEDIARNRVVALRVAPEPPRMQLIALTAAPKSAGHAVVEELLDAIHVR